MSVHIALARTDREVEDCLPILAQLRDGLSRHGFVKRVRRLEAGGYRLVSLYSGGIVRAVAGFHLGENFAWGRYLYVDDLVTDAGWRSKGCGTRLMAWLREYARERGIQQLHLDSGINRHVTHGFYLQQGLHVGGYHFLASLQAPAKQDENPAAGR